MANHRIQDKVVLTPDGAKSLGALLARALADQDAREVSILWSNDDSKARADESVEAIRGSEA